MNILHIAAHLGGGAGKAISGMAAQCLEDFHDPQRVLLLQAPEKDGYVRLCEEQGIPVTVWEGDPAPLAWADVIVVSWWNHPAMAPFLRRFPRTEAPLVLWSHVNGCHYPLLPPALADCFDQVLFTARYSLENPRWTEGERRRIGARAEIVYGMGQFRPAEMAPKARYETGGAFVVGYTGTLNYGKLHPDFVSFCRAALDRVPCARFVMAGDRDERLERDVREAGLEDRFTFPGFVTDVPALLRSFDAFGYLLSPTHYGTTENALLEAMACGLPCAVLRQNVEQFIVPPGGLVETPEGYAALLERLWRDPGERERLGLAARERALADCDAAANAGRFHDACLRARAAQPGSRDFACLGDTPWQWFLFCLEAEWRRRFEAALGAPEEVAEDLVRTCPPVLRERRKSSLRHFAALCPEDGKLEFFKKRMEENEHGGDETEL